MEKEAKIGTGHTEKKVKQKMYCLAKQTNDDEIEFRYLGANDEPFGEVEKIPKKEFVHIFTFQPYYFEQKVEREKKANKHCAIAEEHVKRKELHSAEYEYKNVLKVEEENLRANFGIGNVYLEMGEKEKAKDIFVKISKIDAIFDEKNKHFFNACAIQLRKQELYEESINYYKKAIEISPNDENLFFNLSRAHLEKGDEGEAKKCISKALSIKPDFKEGKAFIDYMAKKKVEEEAKEKVKDKEEAKEKVKEKVKEEEKEEVKEGAQEKIKVEEKDKQK